MVEATSTSAGNIRSEAKTGTDDTVDALALAAAGNRVSGRSDRPVSRFIFLDDDEPRSRQRLSRRSSFGGWR